MRDCPGGKCRISFLSQLQGGGGEPAPPYRLGGQAHQLDSRRAEGRLSESGLHQMSLDVPFIEEATEASLLSDPDGWHLLLISRHGAQSIFVTRDHVAAAMDGGTLEPGHVPLEHFEKRLRLGGY